MSWIKKNYKTVLIIFMIILLLLDITVRLEFTKINLGGFDPSYFNNIVTPIATVISIGLYFYALKLMTKQNAIIGSQNSYPFIDMQFNQTKKVLEKLVAIQPPVPDKNCTAFNCAANIYETMLKVRSNKEFISDEIDYLSGIRRPRSYYEDRSYFSEICFLTHYCFFGISEYSSVVSLIEEIEKSKLEDEVKLQFKKRILNELVSEYVNIMVIWDVSPESYQIPMINLDEKNVKYESILSTNYRNHFDYFKKKLLIESQGYWHYDKIRI